MGKVLEFPTHEVTLTGPAMCCACDHRWTAVAPTGAAPLECPSCSSRRGVFMNHVRYERPTFLCHSCQGGLFSLIMVDDTPCAACAGCGQLTNAIDLFPEL
jgi:hypothetical protein